MLGVPVVRRLIEKLRRLAGDHKSMRKTADIHSWRLLSAGNSTPPHLPKLGGAYNLPLCRQEAIFGRAGVKTARSPGAQWVGSCGVELQPLVHALKRDILARRVVHADETPVQMLKPGNRAKRTELMCGRIRQEPTRTI
jgi:hypothetical protein